jgi:hypothetical protein
MRLFHNSRFMLIGPRSGLLQLCFLIYLGALLAVTSLGATIYDNGNLATGTTSKSGVAAPAGTQWSELQNDFGNTSESNSYFGYHCGYGNSINRRCADDFSVPVGQMWTIDNVIVFAYQSGYTGTVSPITMATLRIWRGRPGDPGSEIVFGDDVTNRLGNSSDSGIWRIGNSIVAPPTAPDLDRKIWQVRITVAPALVLPPGHYWIDWSTFITSGPTGLHFSPAETVVGTRSTPFSNARQTGGLDWRDILEEGVDPNGFPTEIKYQQDFPFKIEGSITGAPLAPRSRTGDYDGDNRTDFAIVRATTAATQSVWMIKNSSGNDWGASWGIGVGHVGGDRPAPADFDADGKTDIAVWRPGSPGVAAFYILRSADNTPDIQRFGMTGDDPTIVGDYDGDGKADPAVYREGTAGGQSTFYYRGSANNPSGNVTYIPWGIDNDVAVSGDFDGDRRMDFSVARNQGGSLFHYQLRTSAGFRAIQYGLPTDKIFTGDFDGDGRSDLTAVRANGTSLDWYILRSSNNHVHYEHFGHSGTDYIVPGDYDGDNLTDIAVWRSGQSSDQANFYIRNTFASPMQMKWGQSSGANTSPDYPVASFVVR